MKAINNFINPFTIEDKDTLYCPSSGALVPSNVENDIVMSDEIGKKVHKQFVQDRLIDKNGQLSRASEKGKSKNLLQMKSKLH